MYQPPNQQPPWQPQPHTDPPSQPQWQQPPTQYPPYQQQQSQYYPPPPPYYQPPPVMFVQPPPPKSSHGWLWLILGIVVALLGMCTCGYVISTTQHNSTAHSSVQTQTTSATQQTGTWTTVQSFSGNGQKKTSIFTVPDHWRLKWKCNPTSDYFGEYNVIIDVYGSDGTFLDGAINTICQHGNTSGETEEYQGGDVYLDLQIDGAYTITVQTLQ